MLIISFSIPFKRRHIMKYACYLAYCKVLKRPLQALQGVKPPMARVTVEDCILHIPNRFELVLLAATRAKQISSGNPLTVERDNDKDGVVSLREIAEQTISLEELEEGLIQS